MIMADVFTALFLTLGALLTLVAYWLLFAALCPAVVSRAQTLYAQGFRRVLVTGLAVSLPGVVLGLLLSNAPAAPIKLIGLVLLAVLILLGQLGSAGLALHIGSRLTPEAKAYPRLVRGGMVLVLTFLLPGIGWFLLLPSTLITGVGACVLALRPPKAPAPGSAPATTVTP